MSDIGGNWTARTAQSEHIGPSSTGDNIDAKKAALYGWYPTGSQWARVQVDANGVVQTSGSGGLPSVFVYGQTKISVTNTAVQLPSNTLSNGVIIQALAANTANVVIGDSSVTTSNGFQLQPGQATSVAVGNTNAIYINGTAGDGVCFIGS